MCLNSPYLSVKVNESLFTPTTIGTCYNSTKLTSIGSVRRVFATVIFLPVAVLFSQAS